MIRPERDGSAHESFTRFYSETHSSAVGLARWLLNGRGDPEDVVSVVYERLWRRWGDASIDDPRAYLFRAVRNQVVDDARTHQRQRRLLDELRPVEVDAFDDDVDTRRIVDGLLPELPRAQRRAVTARYLLDMSEAEAASALGISRGTVKSNLSRGLERLRADASLADACWS